MLTLPKEIVNLFPNRYTKEPTRLKNSDDKKIVAESVKLWFDCLKDENFPISTSYAINSKEKDGEPNFYLALTKGIRNKSIISDDEGNLPDQIASILQVESNLVRDDIFHFPLNKQVDLFYWINTFQVNSEVDVNVENLYMPRYEKFFLVTRGFCRPVTDFQGNLMKIGYGKPKEYIDMIESVFRTEFT